MFPIGSIHVDNDRMRVFLATKSSCKPKRRGFVTNLSSSLIYVQQQQNSTTTTINRKKYTLGNMSTFASQIRDSKCNELHIMVECGGDKYLCYTRQSTHWIICVTDGISLWKIGLDEEETDAVRDSSGINTIEAFFVKFRNSFSSGDVNAAVIGNKVTLSVGKGTSCINMDLFEAKAADKKSEMQTILFRLADLATSLKTDLDKANQNIDNLRMQKGVAQSTAFMDLGPKAGLNQAKQKPKKTGMSVLNPTSKKRKAAQGVVFD